MENIAVLRKIAKFHGGNVRIKKLVLIIILLLTAQGCSASSEISGTVIDAETGKPIEGAVVLVEWTKTKGFGLTHTESYKVVEVLTDKYGKFKVPGVRAIFVDTHLTIYKKGFIAWNNEYIFPGYGKRTAFKWADGIVFKLERVKRGFSYLKHQSFVESSIRVSLAPEAKQLFLKNYNEGERDRIIEEREENDKSKGRYQK